MTGSKKCFVKSCKNSGTFRFPSNKELRLKWIDAIKDEIIVMEDEQIDVRLKSSFLCRSHFEDTDVKRAKDGRMKLKSSAIPCLEPQHPIKEKLNVTKPPSQQKVSCGSCNKVFTRKANLDKHLKVACGNVHCKEEHEHQIINLQFDSFEEGEAYMTSEELDSKFIRRSVKQSSQRNPVSEENPPGSPNKGTIAVYFECRQALKSRKTGKGNNCSAKLVLSRQISEKGKKVQTKHCRLKGCIAHAESCEDEVGRMTKQQKKNITNLLKLGMSRAAVCNRYLGRDHFGGNFGKFDSLKGKNKNSWISKIQRMNHPFPPDPDCNELEMVKRYCSMASVRCYNVGVVVQNLFGYHKKADPAKIKNFLMIFMEDWQREKFRVASKTILVLCIPNIHSINTYNFISILVLDNYGQCIPVMQAITGNDTNTTIREMFETLLELEREACSFVKLIMADNACFNEIHDCFCDIFTDISNVNLTPCHNVYIDHYNRNIQASLRIPNERLDHIIYAIYEANLRYGYREEKLDMDLYGESKPWTVGELERCHPSDVSFEISVQSKNSWSVTQSSWNVGDINTSHFVTFLEEEDPICRKDFCRLRCSKCPNTQFCAHQFNCTCSEFASKRVCTHIHVIVMNDLIRKDNVRVQLDHTYGTSDVASQLDITNDAQIGKKSVLINSEPISSNNCTSGDNEILSCQKSKLISEAKSCLWSAIRYIDSIEDSSTNVVEICKKLIKTTKEILPKNKQLTCQISRIEQPLDEMKKWTTSKHLGSATHQSEKEIEICKKKTNVSHLSETHDVNQISVSTKENNDGPVDDLVKSIEDKKLKVIQNEKQIIGSHRPRHKVLKAALNESVWDFSWWLLACSKPEESLLVLSQVFNSDERDKLLEKFLQAKTVWACGKCQNLSIDSMLSGYIECTVCFQWFHRTCCNPEVLKEIMFEDQFTCDKCYKFTNEQLSQNNVFNDVVSYIVTDVQY